MANGDAAAAEGITLVPPSSVSAGGPGKARMGYDQMNRILDLVVTWGIKVGTALSIARGGTGAGTAAAARTNLNVPAWTDVAPPGTANASGIARYSAAGRLQAVAPAVAADVATKGYVDGAGVGTSGTNLTLSGHLFVPNSSTAVSGYTIAYINGPDGRLSRGASAAKYKKYITEIDPLSLGDLFAPLNRFQMNGGDGTWLYGYIADRLAENPATEHFVIYGTAANDEGKIVATDEVESIDFIQLLLAQVAQLNARLQKLEGGNG